MRVLFEYNNKRVDIKTPISMRQKIEETPDMLTKLINDALDALGLDEQHKKASFNEIARRLRERSE